MWDFFSLTRRCKALFCSRNQSKHLHPHTSSFMRSVAVLGAALLVSASAALGSYFGFLVGAHQHVLLGVVFAAAALGGELLKPFAVSEAVDSLSRFNLIRGAACVLLAAVCIVYSLSAELSLAAGSRGDLAASREVAADAVRTAKADRKRAEAELSSLSPARPAAELQAEIDGLLMKPGADGCAEINGKVTREVCPRVAELKIELARSERRAQLEADIRSATDRVVPTEAVSEADPLAGAVSTYAAALGFEWDSNALLPWLALIPVAFLEIGSALAVVVVRSVGQRDSGTPVSADDAVSQGVPALTGTRERRKKPRDIERTPPPDGTTQRGIAKWVSSHADVTVLSVRKQAQLTGQSKSAVHRERQRLAAV